jgi:hypothetical protein
VTDRRLSLLCIYDTQQDAYYEEYSNFPVSEYGKDHWCYEICGRIHLYFWGTLMYEAQVDLFPMPFYVNGQIDLAEFQIDLPRVKGPRNMLRHAQLA